MVRAGTLGLTTTINFGTTDLGTIYGGTTYGVNTKLGFCGAEVSSAAVGSAEVGSAEVGSAAVKRSQHKLLSDFVLHPRLASPNPHRLRIHEFAYPPHAQLAAVS